MIGLPSTVSSLFLFSRFLCGPLEAIYTLFIFIAANELNVSFIQLTLLTSLKPASSMVSYLLSSSVAGKPFLFKKYLALVNVVAALPVLAFPFVDNAWFYLVSYFIFMVGNRALFPVWTTLLKNEMSLNELSKIQAQAISINQAYIIFCPLLFAFWIDRDPQIWRTLFFLLGTVQLLNSLILHKTFFFPNSVNTTRHSLVNLKTTPLKENYLNFLTKSLKLLKEYPDFRHYLFLFFLGGAGLVMIQATLPVFFNKSLHLSYTTITLAVSVCRGIALLGSSNLWAEWSKKISLYRLNFYINILSTLFLFFVLLANFNISFLFVAYLFYGTMQAGCELSWNLSGPTFAQNQESTLFSSLNLLFIGIRGLIFPFVGSFLTTFYGPTFMFSFAAFLCVIATLYAYFLECRALGRECGGRAS